MKKTTKDAHAASRYIVFTYGDQDVLVVVHDRRKTGEDCPTTLEVERMQEAVDSFRMTRDPMRKSPNTAVTHALVSAGYKEFGILYTGVICRVEL